MNIKLKTEKVKLSTLNAGELFLHEKEVFLRVKNKYVQKSEDDTISTISVVDLMKNECVIFYDTLVVPLNGELLIDYINTDALKYIWSE